MEENNRQMGKPIVQNCANFVPNTKMRRWFEAAMDIKSQSPSSLSRATGVHRNTFYYWRTIPGFIKWWKDELWVTRMETTAKLIDIGMQKAEKGSYKHWRSMLEFLGMLPPKT